MYLLAIEPAIAYLRDLSRYRTGFLAFTLDVRHTLQISSLPLGRLFIPTELYTSVDPVITVHAICRDESSAVCEMRDPHCRPRPLTVLLLLAFPTTLQQPNASQARCSVVEWSDYTPCPNLLGQVHRSTKALL